MPLGKVTFKIKEDGLLLKTEDKFLSRTIVVVVAPEAILPALKESLGKNVVEQLKTLLQQNKFEDFITILLEKYYDPRYEHGMRDYQYDLELSAEDLEQTQRDLIEFHSAQPIHGDKIIYS